jgi:hypothetical protein
MVDFSEYGQPQKERLAFIESHVRFFGTITRAQILSRFEVGGSCATRDLALYQRLAPDNLIFDQVKKVYVIAPSFQPLFPIDPQIVYTWLAHDITIFRQETYKPPFPVISAYPPPAPSLDILAVITRAIAHHRTLAVTYHSLSRGLSSREVVPLALASNGFRYHCRVYDRDSQSFRDFVLSRFVTAVSLDDPPGPEECLAEDSQWQRLVDLELVPHPDNIAYPETIAVEYGMITKLTDQNDHSTESYYVIRYKVRAALAGYLLRHWNVDCSPDHTLRGAEYQLWLSNPQTLYGVENALLSPGYA